ncbi:permease [Ilyobacter polytropus]|uniref:Permease n=1 Tax=Ilyobacter polytropus (strain ATCC 51220 / DSM 2926 / LMG 16218 / CuHBu1) TaxID=572544 RepID=E3HCD3_ILYPC|nr:permease [Ilyobacter polytropus]ADO84393.1 permease [Ilyobacter polytropus DSM 2926]
MLGYIFNFGWLDDLVRMLVENIFKISMDTHLGGSVHFFIFDSIKILILLSIMIFGISYIRSYFSVEKTKQALEKIGGLKAHIAASLFGIVTPFCSCSSVPLFIGFVEGGIPLGVTFSFLITSPIVNEAALVILLGTFGFKVALLYVISGVVIGVLGGYLIHVLKLEKYVEEYVYQMKMGNQEIVELNRKERISFAKENVKDIVSKIWKYLLVGIGIGALIHGWAPEEILSKYAGPDNPLSVIVSTVIAIPLYSNAMGTIPIAEALINKGVGMGTAMAFMMATTALSLPEMILLRKVVKPKLIGIFTGITGVSIIGVGYLFNIII